MANNSQNVQLNLKINGAEAFNTLKDLNAHVSATKTKIIKMNIEDPSYAHVAKNLRELTKKQKTWRNEIYNTQKATKGFLDDFKGGLAGIAGAVSVGTLVASSMQSAIGAVTGFFSNAQTAWVQGEQTQAQLSAAIKSTGSAAGITQQQLNKLSNELMAQTGINSDLIASAEALLLTFTNIGGEMYDKTLPIILDMSKALGQDLKASTIQLGKALNDPITGVSALSEVGVTFNIEQKKVIRSLQETGDVAGAQKVILNELAKEFGGVAEAVAKTNSGQLEAFNTRMEKIQENIGGFITSIKAANLTALEPFVRLLEKVTTTDMSATLRNEQSELNSLVGAISMTNTNQAVRNKLIDDLQAQYPDFLGNIKKEDVSNELLARRLESVNKQYREKIFIASNEEKIKEIQETRTAATKDEADARLRVAKALGLSAEELAKLTDKELEAMAIKKQNEALTGSFAQALAGGIIPTLIGAWGTYKAVSDADAIVNNRAKIIQSHKEEADYVAANAVLLEKVKQDRLKTIDQEIAKLKEKNAVQNEGEIQRLEAEKKSLLGIKDKPAPIGPTPEEIKASQKKADELKKETEKALQEFDKFGEEYKKLKIKQFVDSLSANEKEIQEEKDKYQALIDEREKYLKNPVLNKEQKSELKEQISTLKKDSKASVQSIEIKQEKEQIAQITELRAQFHVVKEREVEKEIALINKKYTKLKQDAAGNTKAIALLEGYQATDLANVKIREEQRFQNSKKELEASGLTSTTSKEEQELAAIAQKYDAKIEALKAEYSEEFQLRQEFLDQIALLEAAKTKAIADKKKEEAQKTKEAICNITKETASAVFSIMADNRRAESEEAISQYNRQREAELSNKELTEEQKKVINAKYDKQIAAEKLRAWKADKEASIVQAVINGALAVVKALPNVALSIAAGAAAAAQIAVMAAQKPPKFGEGGILPSVSTYAANGGIIPKGPTHANGGIALIDTSGHKIGEIEGGEPILSRQTYANNRALIDTLLYSSQRLNGVSIGFNTREAIKADRMFKYGGITPSTVNNTSHTVNNPELDLSFLVHELRDLKLAIQEEKARPVEFNYRVFEAYKDKIEGIRAGVAA